MRTGLGPRTPTGLTARLRGMSLIGASIPDERAMTSRKKSKRRSAKAALAGPTAAERDQPAQAQAEEVGSESTAADTTAVDETAALEAALEARAELESELEELKDRHLRLAAEFDNFRKRTIRERAQQTEQAQAELVRRLLESLDDLARVSELGTSDHDAAAILEGVRLVERKLRTALEGCGLKAIEAAGQPFDPEVHEALVTVPVASPEEDDIISQELVKGYLFKDTLLRPSRVEVKKYQPGAASEEGSDAAESGSDS